MTRITKIEEMIKSVMVSVNRFMRTLISSFYIMFILVIFVLFYSVISVPLW
jgi:hypothetical protein